MIVAVATVTVVSGQVSSMDIDEVVRRAVRTSPDVVKATESVRNAADAIGSPFSFDQSRITISGTYREEHDFEYDGSLSLPLLPQLSLSGSLGSGGSGSVGLELSPFARWPAYAEERGAYETALARLEERIAVTRARAEDLALAYLSRQMQLENRRAGVSLAEDGYEVALRTYELGESTIEDLSEAQKSASDARREYVSAQRAALEAEKSLALLLGPTAARTGDESVDSLSPPTVAQLIDRVNARASVVESVHPASARSIVLEEAQLELAALREEERSTWLWRPNLLVTGSAGFAPERPDPRLSASVTMRFSPNDLAAERKADLAASIADAVDAVATEEFVLELDVQTARHAIAVARESLRAAQIELDRAELVARETKLLYEQGERTELEARQARLSRDSARTALFIAAAELLAAQNDFLLYFP